MVAAGLAEAEPGAGIFSFWPAYTVALSAMPFAAARSLGETFSRNAMVVRFSPFTTTWTPPAPTAAIGVTLVGAGVATRPVVRTGAGAAVATGRPAAGAARPVEPAARPPAA